MITDKPIEPSFAFLVWPRCIRIELSTVGGNNDGERDYRGEEGKGKPAPQSIHPI